MTSRTLIVGATGTNGREVVTRLVAQNAPVRVLARDTAAARTSLGAQVEVVAGDLVNRESLARALDGVDRAYIVTAIHPNTVDLFANFFDAAAHAGLKRIVKFSGLGSDVSSPSTVIRQHGLSDDLLVKSGLDYTILRPNSFHQNMLWQAAAIQSGSVFYLPLGDARQSTIDVRDIADISVRVLMEPGHSRKAYDLTGPESLSFHDVARQLSAVVGRAVRYVPITAEAAESAMLNTGMPEWSARVLAEIQALFATGSYDGVDPTAQTILGRPLRTFASFAADHISAFK
jgi:uncharacterized protein YbjT (DUF2867 family)